ncbi:MAG: flagellar export chaperone FliS [Burkholderiaceae bacterium]|jgi:flagellar protein FliS|nr:flagellar export chaperone FliS [Burkholderiaceae bacterium]
MNARNLNAYRNLAAQTAVSEASPLELIVLVYKRLIDNLRLAQKAMEEDKEDAEHISKSLDLIQKGLLAALDHDKGGEISKNLASLYDWAIREILKARLKRSPETLTGVIEVFRNLEAAWVEIHLMRADSQGTEKTSQTVHISAAGAIPAV